ncbi:gamma-glutamyl-gamma-aminobutyrate hydrolase family protein [Paucilactobacillus suebicus]|uniref:Glutamine amidotransferase n=1 Tax=Paucilactobacillus suebicus DSM 5007 = KCTC 3549 TaxID=1423807 RepID=A0A0R1W3V0_9LACO|nr:gamma-glutamyl-gamma-aminobutyrate hydrolase family protein [Paucilactobacillus suebicus]KRM12175.1 glutamine amidotransferase [Paucilactobacillus suebicus DSM 5007 = KCTC 3549]
MKPRIALPADTFTEATNIINQRNAEFAPYQAIQAITKSGGIPIILPTIDPADAPAYIDLFDGVLMLGGFDVDPTFYNEEPHYDLGETYRKRDLFEIALLKAAIKSDKAVMGICRGIQVINVALGGTLYQDMSENPKAKLKHSQLAPGNLPTHHVNVESDSLLSTLIGKRSYVNSRHHQSIHELAPSLHTVATADDGVIEAVESKQNSQILGVQWHPENMYKHNKESQALFANFIKRSNEAVARKQFRTA